MSDSYSNYFSSVHIFPAPTLQWSKKKDSENLCIFCTKTFNIKQSRLDSPDSGQLGSVQCQKLDRGQLSEIGTSPDFRLSLYSGMSN